MISRFNLREICDNHRMLKALLKSLSFTLLLLLGSQLACADTKLYKENGNLPFVQMMLSMMSAMGMIDSMPAKGAYGGYGSSGLSNPYALALAMRGISPDGMIGNNPFSSSPWQQSPSSQSTSGINTASPLWGSPSWGVLPYSSYATNSYSPSGYYDDSDLSGWVNEPMESSAWNSREDIYDSRYPYRRYLDDEYRGPQYRDRRYRGRENSKPPVAASVPLIQNFTYSVPEKTPQHDNRRNDSANQQHSNNDMSQAPVNRTADNRSRAHRSPLAKLGRPGMNQSGFDQDYPYDPARADVTRQKRISPSQKRYQPEPARKPAPGSASGPVERACVTEFCGLKIPDLNGLWVGKSGEMLGIKNHRYLWSDGASRYLTGQMKIENEYLVASVDDHDKLMRFKYKLAGDLLLTVQPDGTVREFVRTSRAQYMNQFRTDNPGY